MKTQSKADSSIQQANDMKVKTNKRSNAMQRKVKFYKNGQISKEKIFNGKHLISVRDFSSEGQLITESVFNIFSDGIEERYTSYFENGSRQLEMNLKNKKANGFASFWHENGVLEMRKHIVNDIADGPCAEWNEQGVKTQDYSYSNGDIVENDMSDSFFPTESEVFF